MKWHVVLGDEGTYWWDANTPVGDISVLYPDPMKVSDWQAWWYAFNQGDGEMIASGKTAEDCKAAAAAEMRARGKRWAGAFK